MRYRQLDNEGTQFDTEHLLSLIHISLPQRCRHDASSAAPHRQRWRAFARHARFQGGPRPVSYTHLDVYKRQGQSLSGIVGAACEALRVLDAGQALLWKLEDLGDQLVGPGACLLLGHAAKGEVAEHRCV